MLFHEHLDLLNPICRYIGQHQELACLDGTLELFDSHIANIHAHHAT
jgi:hypothetical protein